MFKAKFINKMKNKIEKEVQKSRYFTFYKIISEYVYDEEIIQGLIYYLSFNHEKDYDRFNNADKNDYYLNHDLDESFLLNYKILEFLIQPVFDYYNLVDKDKIEVIIDLKDTNFKTRHYYAFHRKFSAELKFQDKYYNYPQVTCMKRLGKYILENNNSEQPIFWSDVYNLVYYVFVEENSYDIEKIPLIQSADFSFDRIEKIYTLKLSF